VTIRRVTELTAGQEEYARVAGLMFQEDDEIVCLQVGGKPLPIGRLQRSGVSDHGISFRIAPQTEAGRYYDVRNVLGGGLSSTGYNVDELRAYPFYVGPNGFTADRIGLENMSVSVGGSVARLGIYAMHATEFKPDALILDAGTVSLTTTGAKEITINQALSPGPPHYMVWLSEINNVAASAQYECIFPALPVFGSDTFGTIRSSWVKLSVSYGSLPNPFTAGGSASFQLGARMFLRRA
jgi:hypothetical protein